MLCNVTFCRLRSMFSVMFCVSQQKGASAPKKNQKQKTSLCFFTVLCIYFCVYIWGLPVPYKNWRVALPTTSCGIGDGRWIFRTWKCWVPYVSFWTTHHTQAASPSHNTMPGCLLIPGVCGLVIETATYSWLLGGIQP